MRQIKLTIIFIFCLGVVLPVFARTHVHARTAVHANKPIKVHRETSVKTRDLDGLTALHLAAGRGDLAEVKRLVLLGADIFSLDSKMGVSVLHKAVYSGNPDVVDFLLKQGALVDLQSPSNGNTPLHDAIYFKSGNDLRVVRVLLTYHPNLFIRNRAGLTPVDSAKLLRDDATTQLLEDEINVRYTARGRDLMSAVKANKITRVRWILQKPKVNLEEADEQGFTPLLWSAREGFTAIVKLLLEKGANPNHLDQWMQANAGHKAAFWGHAEVMELLIQHGLDINARGGYNGYTALHDAVSRGRDDVVKVLLDHHARVDIRGHDGKTPMDIATASNNSRIVGMLADATKTTNASVSLKMPGA